MREAETEADLRMLLCWFEDRGLTHEPRNVDHFLEAGRGKEQTLPTDLVQQPQETRTYVYVRYARVGVRGTNLRLRPLLGDVLFRK